MSKFRPISRLKTGLVTNLCEHAPMKRISANAIGIAQGSRILFSDFVDGGPMWTGQGDRESRFPVKFDEVFKDIPSVFVSVGMCDLDHKHNIRADISAENISQAGFEIVFRTWGDTRIARVRADWMAMGAATHDEDWELY